VGGSRRKVKKGGVFRLNFEEGGGREEREVSFGVLQARANRRPSIRGLVGVRWNKGPKIAGTNFRGGEEATISLQSWL